MQRHREGNCIRKEEILKRRGRAGKEGTSGESSRVLGMIPKDTPKGPAPRAGGRDITVQSKRARRGTPDSPPGALHGYQWKRLGDNV